MSISKAAINVFTSNAIVTGGTRAVPATGAVGTGVNTGTYYGGDLNYILTNAASPAMTTAPTFLVQSSPDNVNWYDYYMLGGDLVASSINTGTVWLDQGVMYVRVQTYGNIGASVTVAATLQAITGV